MWRMVRMLWSRSDSLTRMTRRSFDIAMKSLRKFSACLVSEDDSSILVSLVTPSTRSAISRPKRASTSAALALVSSTTSCSRAVTMVASSSLWAARRWATSTGWVKYASPERRVWPSCMSRP